MPNVKQFLWDNMLKQRDLALFLGITDASASRLANNRTALTESNLHRLLANQNGWDVSALLDGVPNVTAVAKGNSSNKITIGSHNRVSVAEPVEPEQPSMPSNMVPIIPTSARAGVMGDYSDGVTLSQCEMISSPMGGATCAIRIYGDSMEPKFPSGALAFLRKVDPTIYIEWGRTYVLDTPNGAVMKCIEQSDEPDKVTCVSLNEKYKSYDVPMTGILGWYRVLGAIIFD